MYALRKFVFAALVALNGALALAVLATPADAHDESVYYPWYYGFNATETYYINSYLPLSGGYGVPSQARDAITQSFATWSDLDGGQGPAFNYAGTQNSPNLEYDCAVDLQNSKIFWKAPDPVNGSYPLARTIICDENYVDIKNFGMYFDPTPAGATGGWEVDPTAFVNSNEWDLKSIATHEAGHTTGFYGHFGFPVAELSICPSTVSSVTHTMCNGNGTALGTTYLRSLEAHDVGTLENRY